MTRTYQVNYIHPISNKGGATLGRDVCLSDSDFADRKALAKVLRESGTLATGTRIVEMRTDGDRTIIFPRCPGMTTYWHAVTLEAR
jgi:hypothetical protein